MFRPLRPLPLAALLVLASLPATAQEDSPATPEADPNALEEAQPDPVLSIGSLEHRLFEQDGDVVLYLNVQDLTLTVGDLELLLRIEDLPGLQQFLAGRQEDGSNQSSPSGSD